MITEVRELTFNEALSKFDEAVEKGILPHKGSRPNTERSSRYIDSWRLADANGYLATVQDSGKVFYEEDINPS